MKYIPITDEMQLKTRDRVREPQPDGSYNYAVLGEWVPPMKGFYIYFDDNAANFDAAGVGLVARQEWMAEKGYEILVED